MRADRRDRFKITAANKILSDFLCFLLFREMYLVYLDLDIFQSIIMRSLYLCEKKPRNADICKYDYVSS